MVDIYTRRAALRSLEELAPVAYPETPTGLSEAAAALDPVALWQRIEVWVHHRWSPRTVHFTVGGPGPYTPTLSPATIDSTTIWNGTAFEAVTLETTPFDGVYLPERAIYRISCTVGADEAPAAAQEAFRRLAEYVADGSTGEGLPSGVSSFSEDVPGVHSTNWDRSPAWIAKAMQNSGAADLLRAYRRAK